MGVNYSSQVFCPPKTECSPDLESELEIIDSEQRIPLIYSEWKGRTDAKAHFTIIYCYGSKDDLSIVLPWLITIRDILHVDFVVFEYAGYGFRKNKTCSEQQCYTDIETVYHWLLFLKDIPSERIILMGKDIGTGLCIELASHLYSQIEKTKKRASLTRKRVSSNASVDFFNGFGGMILINPMTSILGLRSEFKGLYPDMFANHSKISNIKCPTFFIHCTSSMIDPKHPYKLSKALGSFSWGVVVVEGEICSNDENSDEIDTVFDKLIEFLETLSPNKVKQIKKLLQSSVPEQFRNSPKHIISDYLSKLELQEHLDIFLSFGFFDLDSIQNLKEEDLDMLNIQDATHRTKLLNPSLYIQAKEDNSDCNQGYEAALSPSLSSLYATPKRARSMKLVKISGKNKDVELPTSKCKHGIQDGETGTCQYCLCEQDPDYIPPAPKFAQRCSSQQYSGECNITQQKMTELNQYLNDNNVTFDSPASSEKRKKIFSPSIKKNVNSTPSNKENKLNS